MIEPYLTYGNIRVLNLPGAKGVYDEVFSENCYRNESIPQGSTVIDVGGFYGEFGIWCAKNRACGVRMYEPSPFWQIAQFNAQLNGVEITLFNAAIGRSNGTRTLQYSVDGPTSSRLDGIGVNFPFPSNLPISPCQVPCLTLGSQIKAAKEQFGEDRPVIVKMDCEGAEQEMFEDQSWIPEVSQMMIEFHYKDGPLYRDILSKHGFSLDTTDPNPEAWRAIIYATRK